VVQFRPRYFCKEGEIFQFEGRTFALTNQWGNKTVEAARDICDAFPLLNMKFTES